MKPVDPKERPKLIAVAVLLVLVLGFVVKTVLGSLPHKAAPEPTPVAAAAPAGRATLVSAPIPPSTAALAASDRTVELGGPNDPFRKVLPDPSRIVHNAPGASSPPPAFDGHIEPLPVAMAGGLAPMGGSAKSGLSVPIVPAGPPIRLDGVLVRGGASAMITVNSRTEMYRVGQVVAGVYTILSISENGATFRGPLGIFVLNVGDERTSSLPAPLKASGSPEQVALSGSIGR